MTTMTMLQYFTKFTYYLDITYQKLTLSTHVTISSMREKNKWRFENYWDWSQLPYHLGGADYSGLDMLNSDNKPNSDWV